MPFDAKDKNSELFFAAVETTRMPMIVTDPRQPDNPIIFSNNAFHEMTGYEPHEIVGCNCRFLQGVETDRSTVADVRQAINEAKEIAVEILNYRKDGSTFWNALFISPVRDHEGNLLYFFASQLDVSRRRDAEDALRQAQKMEALGQLTGGIAHDFNNLLQVISGYHDLVLQGLSKSKPDMGRLTRGLRNASAATDRATTLTQQLLAFARKQRLEGRTVNLNKVVQGMQALTGRTLGDAITLDLALQEDLDNCRLDSSQCEVAMLNILINARDALIGQDDPMVQVKTYNFQVQSEDAKHQSVLRSGKHVAVEIKDNGHGMSPEVLSRVTEPFFTTKEEGKGTGLGLSTVYGFARQSGGTLEIESEEHVGTTVRLIFPAREEEVRNVPEPAQRAVDRDGTETVLVVDDRVEVGDLAAEFLEGFGYSILRGRNSAEALEVMDANHVDLLFTDLIMPGGMNGVMLAREARKRNRRIKILLTTGYAEASNERVDVGMQEFDIIDKPYRRLDLGRRIRMILDGPTGVT